jgi:hypothetical protein
VTEYLKLYQDHVSGLEKVCKLTQQSLFVVRSTGPQTSRSTCDLILVIFIPAEEASDDVRILRAEPLLLLRTFVRLCPDRGSSLILQSRQRPEI